MTGLSAAVSFEPRSALARARQRREIGGRAGLTCRLLVGSHVIAYLSYMGRLRLIGRTAYLNR